MTEQDKIDDIIDQYLILEEVGTKWPKHRLRLSMLPCADKETDRIMANQLTIDEQTSLEARRVMIKHLLMDMVNKCIEEHEKDKKRIISDTAGIPEQ